MESSPNLNLRIYNISKFLNIKYINNSVDGVA